MCNLSAPDKKFSKWELASKTLPLLHGMNKTSQSECTVSFHSLEFIVESKSCNTNRHFTSWFWYTSTGQQIPAGEHSPFPASPSLPFQKSAGRNRHRKMETKCFFFFKLPDLLKARFIVGFHEMFLHTFHLTCYWLCLINCYYRRNIHTVLV